jgi:peptidoglycan/xylan/chitin deacetylase (PgdA/CDA1 family)
MKPRYLMAALALAAGAPGGVGAAERFDIAVTVDDLSVHGPLPRAMTWAGIAESYLATLKAHRVPEAYGFVNAKRIEEQPASEAVLDLWRQAGYPLGNHTFSHMKLSQAPSLAAWTADLKAGEPAIASRMGGADWHYLRFPYLDAGSDQQRHDGALRYLRDHNYRIADVSVSFDDWAYSDAYARCLDKGDSASINAMKAGYLTAVDAGIERMKALSQRVYGRMIPQVLLTHLGAWSAATLPDVMARLDAAGARYVPLARAQADPAYRKSGKWVGNGSLMERTATGRGTDINAIAPAPPVGDVGAICR